MTSEIERLADMMYQREVETIIRETTEEKKRTVQDACSRGLGQSGMLLGKLREIELNKLKRFSKARIDVVLPLLQKQKGIIEKDDITRIYDWIEKMIQVQIEHSKRLITEKCAQQNAPASVLPSFLKQMDEAKLGILIDTKRELEIRQGQINLEAERRKREERKVEEVPSANKPSFVKNWTMNHPVIAFIIGLAILLMGTIIMRYLFPPK